jgi:Domain of unknown function (DUF4123)
MREGSAILDEEEIFPGERYVVLRRRRRDLLSNTKNGATVSPGSREMRSEDFRLLERILWPKASERDIWMIVDAARDRQVFGTLLEWFYSDHICLFSGQLTPELEVAAPYLVRLDYENANRQRFITRAWGHNWGVILKSDMTRDALTSHLRELLLVQDPSGDPLLFRYYDPRVLRVFLPTCTEDELRAVFGGIECFWIEDQETASVSRFGLDSSKLVVETLHLGSEAIRTAVMPERPRTLEGEAFGGG